MPHVAQRGGRCPIPGNIEGQVGRGSLQGVGLNGLWKVPSSLNYSISPVFLCREMQFKGCVDWIVENKACNSSCQHLSAHARHLQGHKAKLDASVLSEGSWGLYPWCTFHLVAVGSLCLIQFCMCDRQPFWAHCLQAGSLTVLFQFPGGRMTGKWDATLHKMLSSRATGDSWYGKVTLMEDIYVVFFIGNSWVQRKRQLDWQVKLHSNRVGKLERIRTKSQAGRWQEPQGWVVTQREDLCLRLLYLNLWFCFLKMYHLLFLC